MTTTSDAATTPASPAPIVLVPGFWLGAWAWDDVAGRLRADGLDVTAVTLPGLESVGADRSAVTFADHVDAVVEAVESASEAAGRPVVLAVHSGAGSPGYAATDRVPARISRMVYVDTGAPSGPMNPEQVDDLPLAPLEQLAQEENLDGISEEQLATFYERAVPEPAAALREGPVVSNDDARRAVPSTVICTAYTAQEYRDAMAEGATFLGALGELDDLTWVELPTSHWPMWSKPAELAGLLSAAARD